MWKQFYLTKNEIKKKRKIARARRDEVCIIFDQNQDKERKKTSRATRHVETVLSDKKQYEDRKRVCRRQRKPEQVIQKRVAETIRRQQKRKKNILKLTNFLKSKKMDFQANICTCCNCIWFKITVIQADKKKSRTQIPKS